MCVLRGAQNEHYVEPHGSFWGAKVWARKRKSRFSSSWVVYVTTLTTNLILLGTIHRIQDSLQGTNNSPKTLRKPIISQRCNLKLYQMSGLLTTSIWAI